MSDSRMGKSGDRDGSSKQKISRASAKQTRSATTQTRGSRAKQNRAVTENRVLRDGDRLTEFRKSFFQSVLPDLPEIPGYHVCWLTTTNPRDSIQMRVRLGYEPIHGDEVPGWEYASLKTGDYVGCIGVNEMVAFKLPIELYQAYMAEAHHHQPQAEEDKIATAADVMRDKASAEAKSGSKGVLIEVEEGMRELGQAREVPDFTEIK